MLSMCPAFRPAWTSAHSWGHARGHRTNAVSPVLLAAVLAVLLVLRCIGSSLLAYGQVKPTKSGLAPGTSSRLLPNTAAMGPSGPLGGRATVELRHPPEAGTLGAVQKVGSEEELTAFVNTGSDIIVKLSFPWCRACKFFMPKYEKLAKIYMNTLFLSLMGNENDSCKHYARETLQVKTTPMFALYSRGRLVKTWTGNDPENFVMKIEDGLPSAKGRMRDAVVAAGYA